MSIGVGLLFVVGGVVMLSYAADQFVSGAARLSVRFQVPLVVVGAVVIGFGTSLPEILVSSVAAFQGDRDLGVGNIVGSNVANLSLVLGVAALVAPIPVSSTVIRRELPLSLGAGLIFALTVQGGLTRLEGVVLLLVLLAALGYMLRNTQPDDGDLSDELGDITEPGDVPVGAESVRTLLGLAGTVIGATLLVRGATGIASELGISGGFVGLTLVAIGTSLPELVTAVAAARKGHTDLIIGNLLGSNIFNSLGVAGVMSLVGPGAIDDATLLGPAMWIMLGVGAFAGLFMISERRVERWEAILLLVAYLASMPFLFESDDESAHAASVISEQIDASGPSLER